MINEMIEEITSDLWAKLNSEPNLTEGIVQSEVSAVVRELRMKRNYIATSMSESDIEADVGNYYSTIRKVAESRIVKLGAEGESQHTENGINRTYVSEDELWKGVHAFVKVL